MSGLKPGDTLAIRSGFYENVGSFSSLTGITIINYQASLILGELYRWEILNRFLFQDRAGKEKPMELVAAGILIDTIECKLNPSGAAIDHRLTFSFIPTDIEGIHRPMGKSSDIGAREFPGIALIPNPNHGAGPEKWLIFVSAGFLAVIFLLIYWKRDPKKQEKSRYLFQGQPLKPG